MGNITATISETSRLWVYQSDRPFTEEEEKHVAIALENFTAQWAAHGQPLQAYWSINYHQFIMLTVDETMHAASGCSIDSSVAVIRAIEQQFGLNLLDRTKIAFLIDDQVVLKSLFELKPAFSSGELSGDSLVFNNAITQYQQWENSWLVPASETWLQKYLK